MNITRTFGQTINHLRRKSGLSQKELAAKIHREESKPISPQYLNDIEHDRRTPRSDEFIAAVAGALDANPSYLAFLAGQLPTELRELPLDEARLKRAIDAFRAVALDASTTGQG